MDLFGLFGDGRCGEGSNIIIWVLLFIIVFGFSKCRNMFGYSPNICCEEKHHSKHHSCSHHKDESCECCKPPCRPPIGGGLFKGNWFFILVIFAFLFLCDGKGKKGSSSSSSSKSSCSGSNREVLDVEV